MKLAQRFQCSRIYSFASRLRTAAAGLLYPPHCAACRADSADGEHLCPECAEKLRRIEPPFCERCSEPFFGEIDSPFECSNCSGRDLHFSSAISAFRSRGVVRDFLHRFKYDGHFYLRHVLTDWLAETLSDPRLTAQKIDALIPVPLHAARLRERSFNQSEALATLLSARTQIPVWQGLQRLRYTTTQTRLDRHARMENLRNAFAVRQNSPVSACQNRHLVLVDDIFTTGSTVEECARVLLAAGAASVRVITVARG